MTDGDRGVLGGRYQVIASLGKGGMGQVYKAYDPILDRTVALKKMIATVVDSEEGRQRFYIEARAAARLNHPNIVTIHELEEYGGDIYIVMELLDGVSLAAFVQQRPDMPLPGYLTILAQIAEGLHYAHKRAIVHRDVKPANLVLTTSGNLKVLDFGIARLASNEITKKGKLLGTPHYMAPEQVTEEAVDCRADLFSLGAVAYELVTGIKPFTADSIPALLMQITSTPHRPVLDVAPATEPALAAIIERLLAKDRKQRFGTGMELVAALDLIGEIDRIDYVAEAVAAVMGPSGEATIYAPIGSTPLPILTPSPLPAPVDVAPPFSATPPFSAMPPPGVTPTATPAPQGSHSAPAMRDAQPVHGMHGTQGAPADDATLSLSAPVRVPGSADTPVSPAASTSVPAAAAAPHEPPAAASTSADAPTLVDLDAQTSTKPDAPPRSVTLNTMVGAPQPPPATSDASTQDPPAPPLFAPVKPPPVVMPSQAVAKVPAVSSPPASIPAVPAAPPPLPGGAAAAASTSAPASIAAVPVVPSVAKPSHGATTSNVPPSVPASAAAPASVPVAAAAAAAGAGAKTPAASAPRGFVNPGVPQARHRSGAGALVIVVGLLLLPAVVALGWWAFNSVRGSLQTGTTAMDTTSPSAVKDANPSAQKPADQQAAATDPANQANQPNQADPNQAKPGETPAQTASQEQPSQTPAVDANAATSTEKPQESQPPPTRPGEANQTADASQTSQPNPAQAANQNSPDASRTTQPNQAPDASRTAPANQPNASQLADARRTVQPNQPPGTNQPNASQNPPPDASRTAPANQAPANQVDTNRASAATRDARNVEPAREAVTDRTRETAPDAVVRDATRESTRRLAPGTSSTQPNQSTQTPTPTENARATDAKREPREPQPPQRDTVAENNRREPAPPVREATPPTEPAREPSTPADTRSLDYGSLSAFRGGSRSTGAASDVYSDSPSNAAAVARITYALEAYGDAIAARDLDALRDVRSPVSPAEATMLKEGRLTVRFSNLDVSLNGNDARVRCRRAVVANGKTLSSGPSDVRLTRRPEGWVITDIR